MISAFVIRFSKSMISKLDSSEISLFWLVSVAGETGLSLTLSETPKTGFVATRLTLYLMVQNQPRLWYRKQWYFEQDTS